MGSRYLFTCPGADGVVIANQTGLSPDSRGVPHCPSGGTWELVEYAEPAQAFDPSQLDPATLASAFGAGFVTMGVGMVLIQGAKFVYEAVKKSLPG